MDARRLDQIAKSLSAAGTRRGALGIISTVPLPGGLVALLAEDELVQVFMNIGSPEHHLESEVTHVG